MNGTDYLCAGHPVPDIPDTRHALTRREQENVIAGMPGGMAGFLKRWGLIDYGQHVCMALSAKDFAEAKAAPMQGSVESNLMALAAITEHLVIEVMRECDSTPACDAAQAAWVLMHKQGLLRTGLDAMSQQLPGVSKADHKANNC